MTSHLTDADLRLLARLVVAHAKDAGKAYPHLVFVVDHILGGVLERERLRFQEDAARVFDRLLREHRAAWSQQVKAQMLSRN